MLCSLSSSIARPCLWTYRACPWKNVYSYEFSICRVFLLFSRIFVLLKVSIVSVCLGVRRGLIVYAFPVLVLGMFALLLLFNDRCSGWARRCPGEGGRGGRWARRCRGEWGWRAPLPAASTGFCNMYWGSASGFGEKQWISLLKIKFEIMAVAHTGHVLCNSLDTAFTRCGAGRWARPPSPLSCSICAWVGWPASRVAAHWLPLTHSPLLVGLAAAHV